MFDVLISWAQRVAKRVHLLCKFRVLFLWYTLLLVRYPTVPPFQLYQLFILYLIYIYFWLFTTSAELRIWALVLPANFHSVCFDLSFWYGNRISNCKICASSVNSGWVNWWRVCESWIYVILHLCDLCYSNVL